MRGATRVRGHRIRGDLLLDRVGHEREGVGDDVLVELDLALLVHRLAFLTVTAVHASVHKPCVAVCRDIQVQQSFSEVFRYGIYC